MVMPRMSLAHEGVDGVRDGKPPGGPGRYTNTGHGTGGEASAGPQGVWGGSGLLGHCWHLASPRRFVFFSLEVAARVFSKPAMFARDFLLPSVLARGFFPLEVAAREFSLPALPARFFFLPSVFALGGFLESLRAGGLASPGSHLGAQAGGVVRVFAI